MSDISETLAPKSDQQGFDDYLTGPRTVTIASVEVKVGTEQPVVAELVEYPGRPYKPNKSMRRVLAKAWGPDSDVWIGRRLTLFGNPAVIWAGKPTGGVEISHMSHLDKPLTMPLTASKGKRKNFTVQPLAAPVQRNWSAEIDAADIDTLKALWSQAPESFRQTIETRAAQLKESAVQQSTGSMLPNDDETTY
jgi:hypothetical protein